MSAMIIYGTCCARYSCRVTSRLLYNCREATCEGLPPEPLDHSRQGSWSESDTFRALTATLGSTVQPAGCRVLLEARHRCLGDTPRHGRGKPGSIPGCQRAIPSALWHPSIP